MKPLTKEKIRQMRCEQVACDIKASSTFSMSDYSHCGSPGCIAGHAVAHMPREEIITLSPLTRPQSGNQFTNVDVFASAARYLGISCVNQAYRLFMPSTFFYEGSGYDAHAKSHDEKGYISATKAASVLRKYGETGVVDWSDSAAD